MDDPAGAAAAELYALDPSEFVAARDELAKRLRSTGQRDAAKEVAKLRRPSASAWALNKLARERPELVSSALEAGARLRQATEAALAGDAGSLRPATAAERAATEAAADGAVRHLGPRGADLRERVLATLRAAILDEDLAGRLRRGVVTTDAEASGFGFDIGGDVAAATEQTRPSSDERPRSRGAAAARAEREQAAARGRAEKERRQRTALEDRLRELEQEATRLAEVADQQEAAARDARAAADDVANELTSVRGRLEELDRPS
jgi:hypothetical protein